VPLYDEEGVIKCTACMNCVRECPDDVLQLDVTTDEDKNKTIQRFTYEVGACMFCGLCVEKCPFAALTMSHEYELATTRFDELTMVLIENTPAASPKRKKAKKAEKQAAKPPEGIGDVDRELIGETAPGAGKVPPKRDEAENVGGAPSDVSQDERQDDRQGGEPDA
jgi:formate hydrogenlyase subunit 6/NADH:ubiquinone oxidoreductase subunit I